MGKTTTQETLLLKIHHSEHTTWQGSAHWVDHPERQHFRSALEFIRLIQARLNKEEGQNTG